MSDATIKPPVDLNPHRRSRAWIGWLLCGAVTSAIVFVGVAFGLAFVENAPVDDTVSPLDSMAHFDGGHYREIVENGYYYDERRSSVVAFCPAYPLTARWLSQTTGLSTVLSLLVVSNAFVLATFVVMGFYLRERFPNANRQCADRLHAGINSYALLAMGVLPTTFFFRMTYSESMFVFLCILSLLAMLRNWPLVIVALIVGAVTATRPVGVGMLLPLAWYVGTRSTSNFDLARKMAWSIPLGAWGLVGYMLFLQWQFDEPLAFALTQEHWSSRSVTHNMGDKLVALLSWEPIWSVYVPGSVGYWQGVGDTGPNPLFNLQFFNPIYFVGSAGLVAVGAFKRWLTPAEVLLSIPLLLIPYLTRAYENSLFSHARFAAVVFPAYIVMGHLLARVPSVVTIPLLMLSALMMAIYAALFATSHFFF